VHRRVVKQFFRFLTDLAKQRALDTAERRPAIRRTVQLARAMFKHSLTDPFFKQERRKYIEDISAKMCLCRNISGGSRRRERNARRNIKRCK
jgi:hypothetical protein